MLKARLESDLHAAMKARDELVTSTLRMAIAAVRNAEVAGKAARELSDDEVRSVLTKEAKKRREAADAFADAGRAAPRAKPQPPPGYPPPRPPPRVLGRVALVLSCHLWDNSGTASQRSHAGGGVPRERGAPPGGGARRLAFVGGQQTQGS